MTQKRYWDTGTPIVAERLRQVQVALNSPGCYGGYEIDVLDASTLQLSAGGFLLLPDGTIVSETEPVELRFTPVAAAQDFSITCRHTPDSVVGGRPAVYAIEPGRLSTLADGVVIGWINYPGGGVNLDLGFIEKAACGVSGSDIGPAAGDLSGSWPDVRVVGIDGVPINTTGLADQYVLRYEAGSNQWEAVALSGTVTFPPAIGDVTGTYPNLSVAAIRSTAIDPDLAPTLGQVLVWDGSQWGAQTLALGGGGSGSGSDIRSEEGAWTVPSGAVVGDLIRATGDYTGALATNVSASTSEVVGMVLEKPTSTTATIVYQGLVTGLVGLTAMAPYYLGVAGKMISVALNPGDIGNAGHGHTVLGFAVSSTGFLFRPEPTVEL